MKNNRDKIFNIYYKYYVLAALFIPLIFIDSGHEWGDDFAMYIQQSMGLINGDLDLLYKQNFLLNSYEKNGPYFYPMGMPILIAPIIYFFGVDFLFLKLYGLFFWIISIIFFKKTLVNLRIKKKIIFQVILCLSISYPFLISLNYVLSDVYFFCFFNVWTFVITSKKRFFFSHLFLSGFIIFILSIIRPTGLIVVFSYFIYFVVKKGKKLKDLIPLMIFIICYFFYKSFFNYDFSSNELTFVYENISFSIFFKNIYYYLSVLMEYFFNPLFHGLRFFEYNFLVKIIQILFIVVCFFWIFLKRTKIKILFKTFVLEKNIIVFLSLFFILLMYLIIPLNQGLRFIFPIIPYLILIVFLVSSKKIKHLFISLQLIYTLTVFCAKNTAYFDNYLYHRHSLTIHSNEVFNFIKSNLGVSDKIVFTKPRALRLYTGVTTLPYSKKALDDSRYLLIEKHIFDFSYTETNYKNIFENEHFKLYLKTRE